jgi:hypothetical protein
MVVFPVPPFWESTAIVGHAVGRIVDTGPPGKKIANWGKITAAAARECNLSADYNGAPT